jgi:hypothetical protein
VLPPGTYEFNYELEATDRDNDQAGIGSATGHERLVLRKPLPPTDFKIVNTSQSASLTWNASVDATSYILEAGSTPGGTNIFNADIGNTTSLQSPVPPGIYYVRVRARQGLAVGPPSEERTFTAGNLCTVPPPAPAGHTVQSVGLSATLNWGSSVGATSYVVEAGSGTGLANLFNADVGGRTQLTAAAPAATYFTRIRGVNACGTGAPSNEVSFTVACTAPATPGDLAFTKIAGVLSLTWARTFGAATYVLQAGTSPGLANVFNGNIGPTAGVSFPLAGVPAGTYFVRVIAAGSCASSGVSAEVVLTVP